MNNKLRSVLLRAGVAGVLAAPAAAIIGANGAGAVNTSAVTVAASQAIPPASVNWMPCQTFAPGFGPGGCLPGPVYASYSGANLGVTQAGNSQYQVSGWYRQSNGNWQIGSRGWVYPSNGNATLATNFAVNTREQVASITPNGQGSGLEPLVVQH